MAERRKRPPGEALVDLRRRLSLLSPRDPGRTEIVARAADAYGISIWTLYRALRELNRPKSVRRADHGTSRIGSVALTWVGHRIGHDGAGLCCGRQGDFAPRVHGGVSQFAMFGSARPVAVNMEEIGDRAVD